jgi:hypothetical protein
MTKTRIESDSFGPIEVPAAPDRRLRWCLEARVGAGMPPAIDDKSFVTGERHALADMPACISPPADGIVKFYQ